MTWVSTKKTIKNTKTQVGDAKGGEDFFLHPPEKIDSGIFFSQFISPNGQ